MRARKRAIMGRINDDGTIAAPWDILEDFARMHKGKAFYLRMEIAPTEPSEKLRNYVFGYVIPTMQTAFYENGMDLSKQETYDALRDNCPIFVEEGYENGEWKRRRRDWEELDSAEAVEFVAWVQRYASENFYTIIQDPK